MGLTITKLLVGKELAEMKSFMEGKTAEDAAAQINQELDFLYNTKLNIAITGDSGTGKSSLVNALRGVDDYDKQKAAKVGVSQTTMDRASYPHPTFPNIVLWDLPGIGTPEFKSQEYLQKVKFSEYDFFIIVAGDRFTEHDANLAREIRKMGKKFYFVRTKVDVSLESERRKPDFNEEATLEEIRSYCCNCLKKAGEPSAKVFLISNRELEKYDFFLLQEAFENNLDDVKKQVLIMAMPAFCKAFFEKKKAAMKRLIWKLSFRSCAVGAVPVPGVSFAFDVTILMKAMKLFCLVFGLDEESLERLADRIGQPVAELKLAVKKSSLVGEIGIKFIVNRISLSAACSLATVLELVLGFIPIIGSLSGAGLSFVTTYYMLNCFLNDVVEDAESVCEKAKVLSKKKRLFEK